MAEACRDWTRALEAEILGEPLSDEARKRARSHERACAACAAERDALRSVRAQPAPAPNDAFVEGVLEAFDRRKLARVRPWPIAAAALAVAAATALFVHRAPVGAPPAPPEIAVGIRVESASGDVRIDTPLRESSVIATGSGGACVIVDPGVHACLDRDSEVRVADLVLARRRLDLARGRVVVSLDPQPKGTSFSVSTRAGNVTAIGTAFSVTADEHGVVARVLHGVVRVHGGELDERLAAHERLDLATRARSASTRDDEDDDQAVLDGRPRALLDVPAARPTEAHAAPSAPLPTKPPTPSPADLLRAARTLRGEHRLAEAAATYRKLQALHPSSNEAHASYVSLGELELGLGDPSGALESFDAYLATPGALAEEARNGRNRALRALGREDEVDK